MLGGEDSYKMWQAMTNISFCLGHFSLPTGLSWFPHHSLLEWACWEYCSVPHTETQPSDASHLANRCHIAQVGRPGIVPNDIWRAPAAGAPYRDSLPWYLGKTLHDDIVFSNIFHIFDFPSYHITKKKYLIPWFSYLLNVGFSQKSDTDGTMLPFLWPMLRDTPELRPHQWHGQSQEWKGDTYLNFDIHEI